MDQLKDAREIIDEADREMARLFARRMDAVRQLASERRALGLLALDAAQEQAALAASASCVEDDEARGFYARFIESAFEASRSYQRRLLEGIRVAYSGVEGAFAHIAASRIFPGSQLVACDDFQAAYDAVVAGDCDVCVLPMENSYAGEVGQVTDLLFTGPLHVTGMYTLPITHHLLGLPDAELSDIRRVVSHPQALSQCAGYITRHHLAAEEASNTARAARAVMAGGDKHVAAIASMETARLYGMRVLEKGINESSQNATRFAVFSRSEPRRAEPDSARFLLLFTVNHVAGALAEALNVIGRRGFNMRALRSRPMKALPWHYYFFAEIEGDDLSESGRQMMRELAQHCNILKVAGRFSSEITLRETQA